MRGFAFVILSILPIAAVAGWWVMLGMPKTSFEGPLPPLDEEGTRVATQLRRDVEHIAGVIGERNLVHPVQLERAADWIQEELVRAGYRPLRQTFEVRGTRCHNVEVQLPGSTRANEIVVLGAHYDTAPGSPGANDNGSGVAALLTLARTLRAYEGARTLRMVWFTNEEAPYFHSEAMGSLRYARRAKARGEDVVAMLSLETMGYFSEAPGSQEYPRPLSSFYPSTGDFIAFVSNVRSHRLLRAALGAFRDQAPLPSEGGALPAALPGVGWSDHWAFWDQGYSALMVTDTAPFRYPHYHTPQDTPDKLDYEQLARVTLGLAHVARVLGK